MAMRLSLLLWVLLVTWQTCHGQPPRLFDLALSEWSRSFRIIINGMPNSINDIFGRDMTTHFDKRLIRACSYIFKMDSKNIDQNFFKLKKDFSIDTYIERDIHVPPLIRKVMTRDQLQSETQPIYLNDMNERIIFMEGPMKMGKTMWAKNMYFNKIKTDPFSWTLFIDVPDIIGNLPVEEIEANVLFPKVIPQNFVSLFSYVLDINPQQITIIFDGLDYLSDNQLEAVFSLIENFATKGTTIYATGRNVVWRKFHRFHETLNIGHYEIPNLRTYEMEKYLKNLMMNKFYEILKIKLLSHSDRMKRLDEYVFALAQVYTQTVLPKTYVALQIIADYLFMRETPLIGAPSLNTLYDVSCLNYVINPSISLPFESSSLPANILTILERIPIDAMKFYNAYLQSFTPRITATISSDTGPPTLDELYDYYGELALKKCIPTYEIHAPIDLSTETRRLIEFSEYLDIIISNPRLPMEHQFTDNGYQSYFAARRLIYSDAHLHSSIVTLGTEIFSIYHSIAEGVRFNTDIHLLKYIDTHASILCKETLKILAIHNDFINIMLLNGFIRYGFTNFFRLTIENYIDHPIYKKQFENYITSDFQNYPMESQIFGLPKTIDYTNDVSFLRNTLSHPNRAPTVICALLQQDMIDINLQLNLFNIIIEPPHNSRLLHIVLTRPITNPETFHTIHRMISMNSIVPEQHLFHIINELGPYCQRAVELLRAAFPTVIPENTFVDGRGLVQIATRWNNVALLDYVINTLKVPITRAPDRFGRTILITAIDSHPEPTEAPEGWWKQMAYLMEHFVDGVPAIIEQGVIIPTPTHRHILPPITLYYYETELYRSERLSTFLRLKPVSTWGINENILAERRLFHARYPTGDDHTLTEFFIEYKNIGTLADEDITDCRRTLVASFKHETALDKMKICKYQVGNIANVEELMTFKALVMSYIDLGMKSSDRQQLSTLLKRRFRVLSRRGTDTSVLKHLSRDIFGDDDGASTSGVTRQALRRCLRGRRTRSFSTMTCYFSWSDIDQFNEATERRAIDKIRVKSENFLATIAIEELRQPRKAEQLTGFFRELYKGRDVNELVGGKYKMLVRDVLQYKSLIDYRRAQRQTNIINRLWQKSPSSKQVMAFKVPVKIMALHAAATIPLIHGIYATITTCLQETNDTNVHCYIGSGALGLSVVTIASSFVAPRVIPWTIERVTSTALDLLPAKTPVFIRNSVIQFGNIGIRFGAKAFINSLTLLSFGFDIYNIVELSKALDICSQQGNKCLNKDVINYAISLTFSCATLVIAGTLIAFGAGFTPLILVGLAMLVLELVALGINEVHYYSNKYQTDSIENIEIFFHSLVRQPPPVRVQALIQRIEWLNNLQQHVMDLLEASNENVVAYGIGIGKVTENGVVSSYGSINMMYVDIHNSKKLSRVLPTKTNRTTLLCLPKEDKTQVYEVHPREVFGANYHCENSFVIAHKERWKNRKSDKSYIVYDLEFINEGMIFGINILNNIFLIDNSTMGLIVSGGNGNNSNTFVIRSDFFRGKIVLNNESRHNILDLTALSAPILQFHWNDSCNNGYIQLNNNDNNKFSIETQNKLSVNLQVMGRRGKQDVFQCNYYHQSEDSRSSLIIIDGGGGKDEFHMDNINDCHTSIVYPFTRITGSNSNKTMYTTHVPLEYHNSRIITTTPTTAIIEPKQSMFVVVFDNRPLFSILNSVIYNTNNETLTWKLRHTDAQHMLLFISPYYTGGGYQQPNITNNKLNIQPVNSLFIDTYFGVHVAPVINRQSAGDDNGTIVVRHFNLLLQINSSHWYDIYDRYTEISSYVSADLFVITKLINPATNETFIIGTKTNDRFIIDNRTKLLAGLNGPDVYALNRESTSHVWIDNQADDCVLDTLIIPETTCHELYADNDNSLYDVTLHCLTNNTVLESSSTIVHVTLRSYLLDPIFQHLQISWRDSVYMLLPRHFTSEQEATTSSDIFQKVQLALLISIEDYQSATLTITSRDTCILFNMTEESSNPLVAYRSGVNDVILARKYFDYSLIVLLQGFFVNNSMTIATDWLETNLYFMIDTLAHKEMLTKILTANEIKQLVLDSMTNDTNNNGSDLIQEYFINITDINELRTIVIDHNNDTSDGAYKLGCLIVVGVRSEDFRATWIDDNNNGKSLSLCAGRTCIVVHNWCHPIHRIYRMEIFVSLHNSPLVIDDMDQIECQIRSNSHETSELLSNLNDRFVNSTYYNDESDDAKLFRCVGSIFADIVTQNLTFKLFHFTTLLERIQFMDDYCEELFTPMNLMNFTLSEMRNNAKTYVKQKELTLDEEEFATHVMKALNSIDDLCWEMFMISLLNSDKLIQSHNDILSPIQRFDDVARTLSVCLANSVY